MAEGIIIVPPETIPPEEYISKEIQITEGKHDIDHEHLTRTNNVKGTGILQMEEIYREVTLFCP